MRRHAVHLLIVTAALLVAPAALLADDPQGGGAGNLLVPDNGTCGEQGETPCPSPDEKERGTSATAAAKTAPTGVLATSAPAPGFTLKDTKGKSVSFDPKALQKPALLVFWSLFCEPCKEELPLFAWIGDKYQGEGLQVIGVNLDGSNMAGAAARFFTMNRLAFPSVMDRKEGKRFVTAEAFGVTGTPSLFLVGPGGTVGWTHVGRVEAPALEAAVRAALGL